MWKQWKHSINNIQNLVTPCVSKCQFCFVCVMVCYKHIKIYVRGTCLYNGMSVYNLLDNCWLVGLYKSNFNLTIWTIAALRGIVEDWWLVTLWLLVFRDSGNLKLFWLFLFKIFMYLPFFGDHFFYFIHPQHFWDPKRI